MPLADLFAHLAAAVVTGGGGGLVSQGTVETWTLTSSTLPSPATGVSQIRLADPAAPGEIILGTNSGGGTLTVTRGAEGTTPVAHALPFQVRQIVTAGLLAPLGLAGSPLGLATLDGSGLVPAAQLPVQQRRATTGPAGTALINGTQTFATWTTPNDGQMHRFTIATVLHVATNETGGTILANYTGPSLVAATFTLFAATQTAADYGNSVDRLAAPNTAVTITQSTALTAGASTLYAELWGA